MNVFLLVPGTFGPILDSLMKFNTCAVACLALLACLQAASADDLFAGSPFAPNVRACRSALARKAERHSNNSVLILDNGYDALLLRIHLIRNATRSIEIQTFIWTNDECGRLIMYELIQAAKRGVKIRIIADHFVSNQDPEIMAFLATVHDNIKVKHYRPTGDRIRPSKARVILKAVFRFKDLNQRMHNKVMVFDGAIAITGGRNIENTYYNHSTGMNFKDRDVMVVGPVVADMLHSFEEFWRYRHSVASTDLKDVAQMIKRSTFRRYESRNDFAFSGYFDDIERDANDARLLQERFVDNLIDADKAKFIADKPGKNRSSGLRGGGRVTRTIKATVGKARTNLVIQSPYFVLNKDAIKVFRKLRSKIPGLTVTVSSNSFGSTDNTAAYSANYRLRSRYVEGLGFRIYEYMPHPDDLMKVFPAYPQFKKLAQAESSNKDLRSPFLCIHAKSFVIDDRIAYIGSYNLDPRSANLNTEVGLLIEDPAVAARLKASILNDCRAQNSWVIAKRQMPLKLDKVNSLFEGLMSMSPIDLWPVRNTTSFALIKGKTAVPPDDPNFYDNYMDAGTFPGADPGLSTKEILTRLYKTVGPLGTPIL